MKGAKEGKEVFEHWFEIVSSQSFSSKEVYSAIEKEIAAQDVPGLKISHVDLSEGSVLSDKREYLRMKRERLFFDVCAAPVGVNYFFSYRFYIQPAAVKVWELVAVLTVGMLLLLASMRYVGPFLGPTILFLALLVLLWSMRNAVGMGMRDLDAALLNAPALGPIYERYFRKDTYYRQDMRMAYGSIVSGIVKQKVGEATAAKGVRLVREYSYDPLFGDKYTRRDMATATKEAEA